MTWKKNVRNVGITFSAATLGLLAAEGTAGAHQSDSAPDQVYGTVTAVATDSVTVQTPGGVSQTVTTTPSTTYRETGTSTVPTVADGDHVDVTLDPADTTPTATTITILLDRISGRVVSVDGSTVRLAERHGFREFVTTPSTAYSEPSSSSSSTGLTPGEFVVAFGRPSSSTPSELVAQFVDITSTKVTPPPKPVGPKPVGPQPVHFPGGTTPTSWPARPATTQPAKTAASVVRPQTTASTDPGSQWDQIPPRSNPQPQPQPGPGGPGHQGPGGLGQGVGGGGRGSSGGR